MPKYILTADGEIWRKEDLANLYDVDELFEEAARLIITEGKGSASIIQRRLEVGYARAARILDQLEMIGILSPSEGNKPRDVLVHSFEEFIESQKKVPEPEEVNLADLQTKWEFRQMKSPLLADLQKEVKDSGRITLPVGLDKKRIVSADVKALGHVYVFNSPLSKATELLASQLEFLVSTYSPDELKLIVSDNNSKLRLDVPHLLTPVIFEQRKIVNALGWLISEVDKRLQILREDGEVMWPKIICVVNNSTGRFDEDSIYQIERLLGLGHLVDAHLVVSSPLGDKKVAKVLTDFPSKIIFKTFSMTQADLLGTDDAFELSSPDKFLFVPAYGELLKLKVNE